MESILENRNLEYKSDIPKKKNDLKAEIVSFLNTDGGTILLGVDNDGNILKDKKKYYKDWEELLNNWIFNAFSPSVAEYIFLEVDETFKIVVKKGNDKPYFYKAGEGFNAKGVYIRIGSSKRLASFEEIQRMIMAKKSNLFETLSCDRNNLTFNYVKMKLEKVGIKFDVKGLSLVNSDGRYNNAALLLSDQNPTISKFAVFQGMSVEIFLDKKEFTGSIMKQLDDMLYFANLSNRKKVVITGDKAQHDEYFDIPKMALREAICNCYCHRDWTLSGDIKVEYYDDRVMIFSLGSLPNGLTLENIKDGVTAKRNPILVNALNKAGFIENYASGVRRIFKDYLGFEKQPKYNISDNAVIVTLYNMNFYGDKYNGLSGRNDIINDRKENSLNIGLSRQNNENDIENDIIDDRKENVVNIRRSKIIEMIKADESVTTKDLAKRLNTSIATINRDIEYLKKSDQIERVGGMKYGKWIVRLKTSKIKNTSSK
ncbi:MAG: transcriptional regulator [Fusobacteriales bacterium]|nr:MAG: transcriptional regulator [Fusobacteriales bacterium]